MEYKTKILKMPILALFFTILVLSASGCAFTGMKTALEIDPTDNMNNFIISFSDNVAVDDIPDAVISYAKEYVGQQADFYNGAGGKTDSSIAGAYTITEAKITGLTQISTGTASLTTDIQMWLLEFRLLPDNDNNVTLAGGMKFEEIDGQNWLTEWSSTGQPYLLLVHDFDTDIWQRICVTNTDVIMQDYNTPDMLELYGNVFTAATMELYNQAAEKD